MASRKTPPHHARERRHTALGMVALLFATAALMGVGTGTAEPTDRVRTIDTSSAGPSQTFRAFDAYPIKTFDINGNGRDEIIAHNDNRFVYVFDSANGNLLAELETPYPDGWGARPLNGPEVDVLVDGGVPHLIVANSAAVITKFRFDKAASGNDEMVFHQVWDRRLDNCHSDPGMDSKPVLVDVNGNGRKEILAYTEESGGYALRDDGSLLWLACISGGNSAPVVVNLDDAGALEVVWASDNGRVTVSNARTGSTIWSYSAKQPQFDLGSASIPVSVGVGQLDGEGPLDIVFGARDSHDPDNLDNNHAALFALTGNGALLWMRQHSEANPLTYTVPIIDDIDGDGVNDVLWADWNTIGHKGGIHEEDWWSTTGPANFYRYSNTGDLVWRQSLNTYWSNKDIPLADVDGDGVQEILANGPGPGGDGIWYLNSITGAKETFVSTHPWKVSRAPVVADLWSTGTMQWVVPVQAATSQVSGGALMIFDTHEAYDSAWPYPPDSGRHTTGGVPPPPPPGDFEASFHTSGGNEWWVEVWVDGNEPVAGVDARANGGPWHALSLRSWGAWAGSFHVPDGSTVEFRAHSSDGDQVTSGGYHWPSGEPTGSEPPPPPPGDFEASFSTSGGNQWWVEVYVDANEPLAGVDARANSGSWVALEKKSWGAWAKSFHVPDGSTVEFRARSTDGDQVTSDGYHWPSGEPAGTPPPPGDFEASFDTSGGNEWWVEVYVDANEPLAGVDARANSGSWVALEKKSWGAWAKSFHVPDGSTVEFRARSTDGDQVTSGGYHWPSGNPA